MTISSSTLRQLAELRLDADQLAGVLRILADQVEAEEIRRAGQAERKRRSRDKSVTVTGQERDMDRDPSPSDKEAPQTPQEINHPLPPPSPPKGGSSPTPRSELEAVLDADHASAVVEHRQRLRKPMTAHAAALLAKRLAQFRDPNAAADRMIEKGWQSIEPGWGEQPLARGSPAPRLSPSDHFKNLDREINGQGRDFGGDGGDWDDAGRLPVRTIEYHRQ